MKKIKNMREIGKLGGRPSLSTKASIGVYETDGGRRTLLLVRIGADLAARLGWKVGTKIAARLPENFRSLSRITLNLAEDASDGIPLQIKTKGSKTLTLQQTATGILLPQRATQIDRPLVIGKQISLPFTRERR